MQVKSGAMITTSGLFTTLHHEGHYQEKEDHQQQPKIRQDPSSFSHKFPNETSRMTQSLKSSASLTSSYFVIFASLVIICLCPPCFSFSVNSTVVKDLTIESSSLTPQARALPSQGTSQGNHRCSGHWRFPSGCRGQTCQYLCQWKFNYDRDQVDFTLSTNRPDKWVGVGFSKDTKMPNSDVVVAWVEPGSRYVMMDAWLDSYSLPIPDSKQSISNISAAAANGLISFFFSRPVKTNDPLNDIDFDSECFHFIFPVGGGSVDIKNRIVMKHDMIPTVTTQKFCFNTCHAKASTSYSSTTTIRPPVVTKQHVIPSTTVTSSSTSTTTTTTTSTTAAPLTEVPPESTPDKNSRDKDEISENSEKVSEKFAEKEESPVYSAPHVPSITSSSGRQPSKKISQDEISLLSDCKGEWKYPSRCTGYGCDYKASWEYMDDEDEILFILSTKHRNKWTGIGFSNDRNMPQTDAIIGLVEDSGRFFLMDTWLRSYNAPSLDAVQNIQNMTVRRENGITSLRFTRKRRTNDVKNDYQFSDTNCPYFLFPVQGGVFNAVNKRLRKHESVPLVSDQRICVKSCRPKPSTTSTSTTTTTTLPPTTASTTTTVSPAPTTTTSTTTTTTTVKMSEFDLMHQSMMGKNGNPAVLDLSKFNGKIPDLSQMPANATAVLQALMEQMNMSVSNLSSSSSKTDFPNLLRNIAGRVKNDSNFNQLFNNQHSPPTPASFPTPKHTSDRNDNNNHNNDENKKTPTKEVIEDEEESEDEEDEDRNYHSNHSVSSTTPSSTTKSPASSTSYSYAPASATSTTKSPAKSFTPKTAKIPSRWSTSRTSTTSTTSTTQSPKSKTDNKHNKPSNEVLDDGEEIDDENEDETTQQPPSVNDILGSSKTKNTHKLSESPSQRYIVEMKFPKAWKASFVRKQSEDYLKFKEKIEHLVRKELSDQFSALEVRVMELTAVAPKEVLGEEDASLTTIAKLKLSLKSSISDSSASSTSSGSSSSSSSSNHPKGKTQEVREDSSSSSPSSKGVTESNNSLLPTPIRLTEALNVAIKDGRFGDVPVDSTYLIVRSLGK